MCDVAVDIAEGFQEEDVAKKLCNVCVGLTEAFVEDDLDLERAEAFEEEAVKML